MNIFKNKYNILIALISFLLLICMFKWINYLVVNNYVKLFSSLLLVEGFDTNTQAIRDTGTPDTTHNVDVPLTTTTSCKNMCGPPNRCSITGQQCLADIDCPGCIPGIPSSSTNISDKDISGNDDAGKLSAGVTYSLLTTDFGTKARIYTSDKFEKPDMPNLGVNTWSNKFNNGRKLFDDKYKPVGLKNMPSYSDRYSLTGEFIDEGPLASNSYLT